MRSLKISSSSHAGLSRIVLSRIVLSRIVLSQKFVVTKYAEYDNSKFAVVIRCILCDHKFLVAVFC